MTRSSNMSEPEVKSGDIEVVKFGVGGSSEELAKKSRKSNDQNLSKSQKMYKSKKLLKSRN